MLLLQHLYICCALCQGRFLQKSVCVHTCLCVCVRVSAHTCVCVRFLCLCLCVCMYLWIFMHACVCVYVCVSVGASVCMHVCVCVYVCFICVSHQTPPGYPTLTTRTLISEASSPDNRTTQPLRLPSDPVKDKHHDGGLPYPRTCSVPVRGRLTDWRRSQVRDGPTQCGKLSFAVSEPGQVTEQPQALQDSLPTTQSLLTS